MEQQKKSPVITMPDDVNRRWALLDKLGEYRRRLDLFKHPELQQGTWYKMLLLEQLFRDNTVNTWDFSRELAAKNPRGFNPQEFNNACGVIEDYCLTGGENCVGGVLPAASGNLPI